MPGYQQRGYGGPPVSGFRGGQNRYGGGDGDPDPNSEQFRKLFIGGLSFDTDESSLKQYFSKWGEIVDCIVMRDPNTKRSRGFGFIKYKDTDSVDSVQKARPHKIDDRDVETKRAMPRDDPSINNQQTVNKMFVGGLKDDTTEDMVRDAFVPFGEIKEIELINDKATGKSKGFCFVTFEDYDAVDKCVLRKRISLNSRKVEVKKAFAKGEMDPRGGRMPNMGGMGMGGMAMGRGGRGDFGFGGTGYGGGYGGYGPSFGGGGGGYGAGGWQGGYNDYGSYGPSANQGNPRFGGNNYGGNNNYGGPGGFNRR